MCQDVFEFNRGKNTILSILIMCGPWCVAHLRNLWNFLKKVGVVAIKKFGPIPRFSDFHNKTFA